MAFDSLSEKLQNVFKNLRSKGKLTEDDVKAALKEVKMALLEADVNFKVVKQFTKSVQERAIGQDVMNGLNPGQMVIKIVNEEMIKLMGSETTEIKLQPGKALTVIMMEGLQGAGKTTTAAKLAGKFKLKGKKVLLTACDIYRPGAIEQLQINGEKQGVEVFSMGDKIKPVNIAKAAIEHAAKNEFNIVILDTAGRLHIDDDMMEAAQSLGASRTEAFMKVIFPMSLPGIIVGGILVFTGTLTAYTTPQLLGGNSNMVMATLIYQRAMSVSDWTGASVIALIMIVVTLVVIKGFNALAARLDRRGEDYA